MKDKYFLDSNIFLYAFSTKDLKKQKIASSLVNQPAIISTQVINEVSNNMLKKLQLSNNDVEAFIIDCYEQYSVINFTKNMFVKAAKLREKYMFSYYDSLIVSSALLGECDILYSEDMQHNLKVEKTLTIVNPFTS